MTTSVVCNRRLSTGRRGGQLQLAPAPYRQSISCHFLGGMRWLATFSWYAQSSRGTGVPPVGSGDPTKGPSVNKLYILPLAPGPAGKARATSIPGEAGKEPATQPARLAAAARAGAAAGGHQLCSPYHGAHHP